MEKINKNGFTSLTDEEMLFLTENCKLSVDELLSLNKNYNDNFIAKHSLNIITHPESFSKTSIDQFSRPATMCDGGMPSNSSSRGSGGEEICICIGIVLVIIIVILLLKFVFHVI